MDQEIGAMGSYLLRYACMNCHLGVPLTRKLKDLLLLVSVAEKA